MSWIQGFSPLGVALVFNGVDQDNFDAVYVVAGSSSSAPWGQQMINGVFQNYFGGSTGNPTGTSTSLTWSRVQFDGTTLKVWQIVGTSTPPTGSAWTAIVSSPELSTTSFRTTGGRIGFIPCYGGYDAGVGNLTLKSWDTGTSAFDITEATENFTMDGSNYADDTLTSDDNGNQTYDGTQAYTYDAWNRLKTVAHSCSSSVGGSCTGQVSSTTSYDALGRRIVKTVTGTGQWDGTLNYYLDGDSVIEEQNGSAMTVKQFIWGNQYIDDLIQVSLNSSPSTQSTCDTPYWGMCDANWNVLGLVNSSGVLTERYEYTAYGERMVYMSAGSNDPACYATTAGSQRFVTSGSVTQFYGICEVGFQGLMHDEECGLVYSRIREDNPILGRWMEEDLLKYTGGASLFGFDNDNPIKWTDPYGALPGDPLSIDGTIEALLNAGYTPQQIAALTGASLTLIIAIQQDIVNQTNLEKEVMSIYYSLRNAMSVTGCPNPCDVWNKLVREGVESVNATENFISQVESDINSDPSRHKFLYETLQNLEQLLEEKKDALNMAKDLMKKAGC